MALEMYSPKRNRVYKRKFDHDEARRLYATESWSYSDLAKHFGVSDSAVRRVVDPEVGERMYRASRDFMMSGVCVSCGGPCFNPIYRNHPKYPSSQMCRNCWAESKQTRFRFDEMGLLTAIRCTTCKEWKDESLFPRSRGSSRGRHSQCRQCGTKARQDYRLRRRVPCESCGALCLPPKEKGPRGGKTARCRDCFHAQRVGVVRAA